MGSETVVRARQGTSRSSENSEALRWLPMASSSSGSPVAAARGRRGGAELVLGELPTNHQMVRPDHDLIGPCARLAGPIEGRESAPDRPDARPDPGPIRRDRVESRIDRVEGLYGVSRQDRREGPPDSVPRLTIQLVHRERGIHVLGIETALDVLVGFEDIEGLTEQKDMFDLVDVWRMHRAGE